MSFFVGLFIAGSNPGKQIASGGVCHFKPFQLRRVLCFVTLTFCLIILCVLISCANLLRLTALINCQPTGKKENYYSSSMNSVKLQDTKLIQRNLLHFHTLTTKHEKEKLKKQSHLPLHQKE